MKSGYELFCEQEAPFVEISYTNYMAQQPSRWKKFAYYCTGRRYIKKSYDRYKEREFDRRWRNLSDVKRESYRRQAYDSYKSPAKTYSPALIAQPYETPVYKPPVAQPYRQPQPAQSYRQPPPQTYRQPTPQTYRQPTQSYSYSQPNYATHNTFVTETFVTPVIDTPVVIFDTKTDTFDLGINMGGGMVYDVNTGSIDINMGGGMLYDTSNGGIDFAL